MSLLESLRRTAFGSSEGSLLRRIKKEKVPEHVAVIMDGNGRWARRRGLPRIAGHRAAAETVRRTIKVATEIGVKYLTLYTFSVENWTRPADEVSSLMALFEEMLTRELDELDANDVKIRTIGRMAELPESTRECFTGAVAKTADNAGLVLIIAINYGARTEIVDALRSIIGKAGGGEVTTETVAGHLYTAGIPDPELVVRTSGEMRVSNFLLWQIAYAELWVTPVLWPDFSRADFLEAIYDFQRRRRRFGGVEDA